LTSAELPFGSYQPTAFQARMIALGRSLPRTRTGRRTASALRSILSRVRTEPLDLDVLGQRMRLHPGNNSCEKRLIVTPQFFDPDELALLNERIKPGFVFVDIGSNVGTYSVFVALRGGPDTRVIAIDPNDIVLERLRFNLAANGLENVRVLRTALGDKDGTAEFAIDVKNMGGSSLRLDRNAASGKRMISVPVRRLLDVVMGEGLSRIDGLKIDVEGYEDRVLVPYFSTAPESLWPQMVIIERSAQSWETDCLAMLKDAGYTTAFRSSGNDVLVRPNPVGT
jgi:FkbM family methyltransferase